MPGWAGAFYALAAVVQGELDLGEVQQRLRSPSGQREPVKPRAGARDAHRPSPVSASAIVAERRRAMSALP